MSDEERFVLVNEMADYIIENKSSTRKTAEHFNVSNATVSDYMNNRLRIISSDKYKQVKEILKNNKPKTVDDKQVKTRVLKAYELLKNGLTINEIADLLGETEFTIYRDISTRLKKILPEEYEDAKIILEEHSLSNLNNVVEHGKRKN